MTIIIKDRVKQIATAVSPTGALSLTNTPTGYVSFGSVLSSGIQTYYCLENGAAFEVGIGTYGASGPNTLSRDTILTSSTGSRLSVSGRATVFITVPAAKFPFVTESGELNLALTTLNDVSLTAPASGESLKYNGSSWVNGVVAGYTTEEAQDAVGGILTDTSSISFSYNDGAPSIAASVRSSGITDVMISGGVDALKIGSGSVSSTEFGYLDGVTSSLQVQLDSKYGSANPSGYLTASVASSTYQPLDSDLTSIASTGVDSYGIGLLTKTSGSGVRGYIGAGTSSFDGAYASLSGVPSTFAPSAHTHGNITNAGAIGSTTGLPIVTTASGVLTAGSFGTTAGTFAAGDDSRITGALSTSTAAATYAVIAAGQPISGTVGQVLAKNSGTNYDSSWTSLVLGDRYLSTSTTSNAVSNGTKTFTIGTGLAYTPTQNITIAYDVTHHMHGEVTTYNSGTGVLVVDINNHTGTGTYTSWVVNVGGVTPVTVVSWGDIIGTLGTQSDLSTALNAKLEITTAASTYLPLAGGTLTGPITGTSNTVQFRSSTTAQLVEVFNTYTSATSLEAFRIKAVAGAAYQIGSAIGSAGGTNRAITFGHWNTAGAFTGTAGITTAGRFSDNAGFTEAEIFGVGATGAAYSTLFGYGAASTGSGVAVVFGGSGSAGSQSAAFGYSAVASGSYSVALGNYTTSSFASSIALGRGAVTGKVNQLVIGATGADGSAIGAISEVSVGGNSSATPYGSLITSCSGLGTNIAGASFTLAGGKGTGTGVGGSLKFQVAPAGSAGSALNSLVTRLTIDSTGLSTFAGPITLTQPVSTTGSPTAFTVTGAAHTTLTLSTEATDVNFNLARTVQFATGALTTQRAMRVQAPTYGFVGASTITTASTLSISGPPVAGTNATITNAYALNVESGNIKLAGHIVGTSMSVTPQSAYPTIYASNTFNSVGFWCSGDSVGTCYGGGVFMNYAHTNPGATCSFGYNTDIVLGTDATYAKLRWGTSLSLGYDAAQILAQRNGTNAQTLRVYNTYTSSTSFENLQFKAVAAAAYQIGSAIGSAGGTNRAIEIGHYSSGGTFTSALSIATNSNVGIGTTTPSGTLHIAQAVATTGSPTAFTLTGAAHTTLALSTEATDVNFNLARTVQFATGALTTQRAMRIQAPTYGFVGASTITTASTLSISGPPVAGTNATITNAYALNVESGTSNFGGEIILNSNKLTFGSSSLSGNVGAALVWTTNYTVGFRVLGESTGRLQFSDSGITLNDSNNIAWTSSDDSAGTKDLYLYRDAAGILAQRNSTNAQTFSLYNTYTSSTSYERLNIKGKAGGNFEIGPDNGVFGGTMRGLTIGGYGDGNETIMPWLTFDKDGNATFTNSIIAANISGNLSGSNSGDQDLSGYLTSATAATTYVPLTRTLNTLALSADQTFAVGTTGTDFAIESSGTAHTFNIPDASDTARGLITTETQTIAGAKTFSGPIASAKGIYFTSEPTGTPSGTTQTLTLADGNHQTLALTSATGTVTATLTVPTGSSSGTIIVKQHASAAKGITWAVSSGTIKWMGTQPTWSSDAVSAVRIVSWRWGGSVMYLVATEVGT